jgi:hypothetical protein
VKFYLPNETVRVNKCLLSSETEAFRAYETGAAAGGGSTQSSSASSTSTTAGGGSSTPTTVINYIPGSFLQGLATSTQESHYHSVDDHEHTVTIPDHSHGMDHIHNVTFPDHAHPLTFGIFEHTAVATASVLVVDGTTVTAVTTTSITDFDLVPYLDVDGDGKITRGAWHTVEITPNNLARVTAAVVKQLFLQSRGGGDY